MRNLDADEFFENFLIASVAAILGIRGFLHLSGYPTVGGDSLHIAHMLWGGVLMLVALGMLLGFLGKTVKSAAAVIGGAGWGTFIDELGKFLTHDNDYFFRPTFALIYVTFVLMYVVWEAVHRRRITREEVLANALELTLEAVRKDMDAQERQRALDLLATADPTDPVATSLRRAIEQVELAPPGRPGPLWRVRHYARGFYEWLIGRSWWAKAVIVFFVLHAVNMLFQAMALLEHLALSLAVVVAGLVTAALLLNPEHSGQRLKLDRLLAAGAVIAALALSLYLARHILPGLSLFGWAEVLAHVAPALIVLIGVTRIRRSRLEAYRTFKTAILIVIFITQFFAFYHQQLLAMLGLTFNILVWLTLRSMIQQEERFADSPAPTRIATHAG
jgi:hypothetical protein